MATKNNKDKPIKHVCPQCGRDLEHEFAQWAFEKTSRVRKKYWENPSEGHREKLQKSISHAMAVANDPAKNQEKGRRLFESVPMETRMKYLAKAQAARKAKMPEIMAKLRARPEHQLTLIALRRGRMLSAARKRLKQIQASADIDQDKPVFWLNPNRCRLSKKMNITKAGEIKVAIQGVQILQDKELFVRVMPDMGVSMQTVYAIFDGTEIIIGDVIGMDVTDAFARRSDALTD